MNDKCHSCYIYSCIHTWQLKFAMLVLLLTLVLTRCDAHPYTLLLTVLINMCFMTTSIAVLNAREKD